MSEQKMEDYIVDFINRLSKKYIDDIHFVILNTNKEEIKIRVKLREGKK